jgi:uncharacterized protein YndB with AHSA1/START domain
MADQTYTVERSTTIDATPDVVYAQLADFHNWARWSPWEDVDPEMQRTYSGSPSGAGAVYAWQGNRKAGRGRMEITGVTPASRVVLDLVFEKPFKARNDTYFRIEPQGSSSHVTWSMTGKQTALTKVMSVFVTMETFLGRDFEKGLSRLKAVCEGAGASSPG